MITKSVGCILWLCVIQFTSIAATSLLVVNGSSSNVTVTAWYLGGSTQLFSVTAGTHGDFTRVPSVVDWSSSASVSNAVSVASSGRVILTVGDGSDGLGGKVLVSRWEAQTPLSRWIRLGFFIGIPIGLFQAGKILLRRFSHTDA